VYDSWLDDGFHFFVFVLASNGGRHRPSTHASYAVFAMHPESPEPVSAITVVPTQDAAEAEVTDLQPPGGTYLAPYPFNDHLEHHDRHS